MNRVVANALDIECLVEYLNIMTIGNRCRGTLDYKPLYEIAHQSMTLHRPPPALSRKPLASGATFSPTHHRYSQASTGWIPRKMWFVWERKKEHWPLPFWAVGFDVFVVCCVQNYRYKSNVFVLQQTQWPATSHLPFPFTPVLLYSTVVEEGSLYSWTMPLFSVIRQMCDCPIHISYRTIDPHYLVASEKNLLRFLVLDLTYDICLLVICYSSIWKSRNPSFFWRLPGIHSQTSRGPRAPT